MLKNLEWETQNPRQPENISNTKPGENSNTEETTENLEAETWGKLTPTKNLEQT